MKATSPPGVIISVGDPVQMEDGGRDLRDWEVRKERVEG